MTVVHYEYSGALQPLELAAKHCDRRKKGGAALHSIQPLHAGAAAGAFEVPLSRSVVFCVWCGRRAFPCTMLMIARRISKSVRPPSTFVQPRAWASYLHFSEACDIACKASLAVDMIVLDDFLSNAEEESLFQEVHPYMSKLRYEFDHWDDAIHGYRETERLQWNEINDAILQRVRMVAFPPGTPQLKHVHVLDLSEDGYIKPHIDSVRFCGNTIAGLSLLTDCVMRLVHHQSKDVYADVLLSRKSLYIMKDTARYDFTHEILSNSCSKFRDQAIFKNRRLSIICRNEPPLASHSFPVKDEKSD